MYMQTFDQFGYGLVVQGLYFVTVKLFGYTNITIICILVSSTLTLGGNKKDISIIGYPGVTAFHFYNFCRILICFVQQGPSHPLSCYDSSCFEIEMNYSNCIFFGTSPKLSPNKDILASLYTSESQISIVINFIEFSYGLCSKALVILYIVMVQVVLK
jgi:hypothetical protein